MSETEPLSETVPEGAPEDSGFLLRDAVWLLVAYIGAQILVVAIYMLVDTLLRQGQGSPLTATSDGVNRLVVVGGLGTSVVVLFLLRWIARHRHAGLAAFGLVWPRARWMGVAVLAFVAFQIVIRGLTLLAGDNVASQSLLTMNGLVSGEAAWNIVSAVLIVLILPVIEELLFRVVLFRALARHMPPMLAAGLAVVVFGAVHVQYVFAGGLVGVLMTFGIVLLGAVLMWLYLRSGSILPSIFFHVANNALAFLALLFVS